MYIYIYMYMYIYIYIHIHIHISRTHKHTDTHTHTHMIRYLHTPLQLPARLHTSAPWVRSIHTHIRTYLHEAYIHIYKHICTIQIQDVCPRKHICTIQIHDVGPRKTYTLHTIIHTASAACLTSPFCSFLMRLRNSFSCCFRASV
jgi:hypothetical protein